MHTLRTPSTPSHSCFPRPAVKGRRQRRPNRKLFPYARPAPPSPAPPRQSPEPEGDCGAGVERGGSARRAAARARPHRPPHAPGPGLQAVLGRPRGSRRCRRRVSAKSGWPVPGSGRGRLLGNEVPLLLAGLALGVARGVGGVEVRPLWSVLWKPLAVGKGCVGWSYMTFSRQSTVSDLGRFRCGAGVEGRDGVWLWSLCL